MRRPAKMKVRRCLLVRGRRNLPSQPRQKCPQFRNQILWQ
jgi:hypothetical protein